MNENEKDLAHQLVHTKKTIRDAAFKKLCSFLSINVKNKVKYSETDLLKINHQLFYAFYMSDRVPVQMELAEKIAELVPIFGNKGSSTDLSNLSLFLKTFYSHMSDKWSNLDKHRVDKYYSLMRKVLSKTLTTIQISLTENKIEYLYYQKIIFWAISDRVDLGVKYHITDIFKDELLKVVDISSDSRILFYVWPFFVSLSIVENITFIKKSLFESLLYPIFEAGSPKLRVLVKKSLINIAKTVQDEEKRNLIYSFIEVMQVQKLEILKNEEKLIFDRQRNYVFGEVIENKPKEEIKNKKVATKTEMKATTESIAETGVRKHEKKVKFSKKTRAKKLIKETTLLKKIKKRAKRKVEVELVSRLKVKLPVDQALPKRNLRSSNLPKKVKLEHNLTTAKRNMKKNERMSKQFKLKAGLFVLSYRILLLIQVEVKSVSELSSTFFLLFLPIKYLATPLTATKKLHTRKTKLRRNIPSPSDPLGLLVSPNSVGDLLGELEGEEDGRELGEYEGSREGRKVGLDEGVTVGETEGLLVGCAVGRSDGFGVGDGVGRGVGAGVGRGVGEFVDATN
eukprot:snap_masked-scaffold_2-processed-gene-11.12-mRNA-1 protein AED:1.00 eAED:1.00 QI:0/0/0/0/1/1/4/0/566